MYPTTLPNIPEPGTAYMPYFYKRGLFTLYDLKRKDLPERRYTAQSSGYDFSSDLIRPHHFENRQSVENIIAHGYFAVPHGDVTTSLISDKKHSSWLGLDDIIGQIRGRYQIYDRNMYEMEQSKCEASNSLFRLVARRGGAPPTSKEVYSVTKKMQDIYQQQREERVSLWKDISRLKLSLPETIQQYLSAYRKMSILDETKGDQL